MRTDEIRSKFLAFFESKDHKLFVSDSLVPKEDPTLLFTSAGMNQFKDYYLGKSKGVSRAASSQRCLRTGDLEKVGKTSYHHTFFEMLGNFSFGDYFKEEAIAWAWQFLTDEMNLKEKDLWVSVYLDDEEAYNIWKEKIGIPGEKILKFGPRDNFWPSNALEDGPDGPCGPCSEIFFDWGKDRGCGRLECNPSCSCGRFVEVWNLVFTQFNRVGLNKTEPLPSKNIDTGMGLERLASVLQGKLTNFEIDIFKPITDEVEAIVKQKETPLVNAISDHVRAVTFAVADGIYPSNEERGYVIRRILRRALWYGFSLGRREPFLYSLVPLVGKMMSGPYPEVSEKKDIISSVILAEEERFLSTVEKGREVLFSYIKAAVDNKKTAISGHEIFTLYDTYGFPYELTQRIVGEKGLKIDRDGFQDLLEKQRESSRRKSKFEEGVFVESDFIGRASEFIGYDIDCSSIQVTLKDILTDKVTGKRILILDKTPFYFTSGGQLHDKGLIINEGEKPFLFEVEDVEKIGNSIVQRGIFKKGDIADGRDLNISVKAAVDMERRAALARAHTSTHLLQASLRKILGEHVQQQGSLVDEDYFRFDFSHFKRLTGQQIISVEEEVNAYILRDLTVEKVTLSFKEAKKQGALAFFEEKYEDKVRMVRIADISKELCGGIHLEHTSQAGVFVIISESSVSSGIRRIEALTGAKAYGFIKENSQRLQRLASVLKTPQVNLEEALGALVSLERQQFKTIHNLRKKLFEKVESDSVLKGETSSLGDVNLAVFELKDASPSFLRQALDILKEKAKKKYILLGFIKDKEKLTMNMAATKDILDKDFSCKEACLRISEGFGGSGGGRPDFGFAGTKNAKDLSSEKMKKVTLDVVRQMLKV